MENKNVKFDIAIRNRTIIIGGIGTFMTAFLSAFWALYSAIIASHTGIYTTIDRSFIFLMLFLLVLLFVVYYIAAGKINDTFLDDGIALKDMGASIKKEEDYKDKLSANFKYTIWAMYASAIVNIFLIFILLYSLFDFAIAWTVSFLLTSIVGSIYPNLCKIQIRKGMQYCQYNKDMTHIDVKISKNRIATHQEGKKYIESEDSSRATILSKGISKSKSVLKKYMYILAVLQIIISISFLFHHGLIFGLVDPNYYYGIMIAINSVMIIGIRKLYSSIGGSEWEKKQKFITVVLGVGWKKTLQSEIKVLC